LADNEIKKIDEIMRIVKSEQREDTVSVKQRRRTIEEIVEKKKEVDSEDNYDRNPNSS
jgi:phosphoglycerate-specific signal transduction histidine kinase